MANQKIRRAVRLALASSAAVSAMYGMTAVAQDQPADDADLGTVVVTGSRIPQPNIEGASPVSVIGNVDIKVQGVTQVEDLVNNLPQVFADQGGNIANGASGTATVNLRNLGADRTLVLVNGRRLPAGSVSTVATDLNQIPAPLIERVEVLTGGASAVYGADAVAGVVNFIMNDNFEGVQFDVNYNFYNHSNSNSVANVVAASNYALPEDSIDADGEAFEVSLLMGANFADGRGNATVFFGYREIEALLQSERDYSACALGSTPTGFVCGGSGTGFPGRFIDLNVPSSAPDRNLTVADSSGGVRPWTSPADLYNYGPLNYYQRPDERYSFGTYAHYDVNEYASFYTELAVHDDSTIAQIAPSGMFGLVADIECSNPLLSAAWVNEICTQNGLTAADQASVFFQRRNVEGGGRQDDLRHSSYRGVVGVKGTVADNWDYDVFGQYGTVLFQETYLNDFSFTRSGRAMDVVDQGLADGDPLTPENNVPVCRSVIDGSDPNCVPYNIWTLGGVTQEALDYLQTPGFARGNTSQTVIGATIASDLGAYGVQLPTANSGIGVAFGVEYRDEVLDLNTDQAFSTFDLFGQGGPFIGLSGSYDVRDAYVEARIPLVEDKPGVEQLTLSSSYRYSEYSTGPETDTYGVGLDWAPIQDVKLRGTYQRAVRAPNVVELFQAQGLGLYDNDNDPCGPAMLYTQAQCANTGLPANLYGDAFLDSPAGQYNFLGGGNPDLTPETSDSLTFGVVFTPSFLANFSVTVDYFNIKVEEVVDVLQPTTTLTQCLETGDPLFCSLITRDQFGSLWATPQAQIVATNINLGTWETSGFDVAVNYKADIGGYGQLDLNFIGTALDEFLQEPIPGLGEYDCAGLYGSGTCGTPLPEWRHKLRATWLTPWNLDLSLTWRHFDSVLFERTSSNPLLAGTVNPSDRELDAQNYLDFAGSWTFMEGYTFRMGVNNLTDEDPPVSAQVGAGFGNGNTFPQVYDAFGRYVFLSLSAKY